MAVVVLIENVRCAVMNLNAGDAFGRLAWQQQVGQRRIYCGTLWGRFADNKVLFEQILAFQLSGLTYFVLVRKTIPQVTVIGLECSLLERRVALLKSFNSICNETQLRH